jgi:polyferredoxin
MLKTIRKTLAIAFILLFTFLFLDYAEMLPNWFSFLAKIQFFPALMAALELSVGMLLILLIITFIFGRLYCSIICPLGIFQDFISYISKKIHKKKRFSFSKAKNILRYSILGIVVIAIICSFTVLVGILDPYAAYGRIVTHLIKPIYLYGNNILARYYESTGDYYLSEIPIAISSIFALIVSIITFLVVAILAYRNGRTYCNTICPVGTMLGFVSKYSIFKIRINAEKCNSCELCSMNCKSACIDAKNKQIDYSRCVDCFNCIKSCKRDAMSFNRKLELKNEKNTDEIPSHTTSKISSQFPILDSRRKFLNTSISFSSAVVITSIVPKSVMAVANNSEKNNSVGNNTIIDSAHRIPITPPGSQSIVHFVSRCTSCHLCINRCPQNVLKPAKLEYGISGIMQPTMDFGEKGFCNYECDICSKVCENNAIIPFNSIEEKKKTQIGIAIFTKKLCQVMTMNISCGKCAEVCPTGAITLINHNKNQHKIPSVAQNKCIGCGACEYNCPTAVNSKSIFVQGNKVHKKIK